VKEISLRVILEHANKLSVSSLRITHIPEKSGSGDIRDILAGEVKKYRNRFVTSFLLLLPILIFMWAIPYALPEFLTDNEIQNNFTLYLLLVAILSTII
jgi:hypothetical protein